MTTTAAAITGITTTAWPGCAPRLLRAGVEDDRAYREAGGYQPPPDADELLDELGRSGLRGRGGAAFPLSVKVASVRDYGRRRGGAVVIANGEEGEPTSIKDRWLLRNRPHLVLDGLRLAAHLTGAQRGIVYVSDPHSAHAVETALAEPHAATLDAIGVTVVSVAPGYVAGEETAAIRFLNGGPAKPADKPPRPYQRGVDQLPTLVSNVETLANLPYLQHHGANEFRSQGTHDSPGTFLATISGAGRTAGLYEVPHGVGVTELLARHGISPEKVRGVLMGGYFAGLLNHTVLDATLDHETLRAVGSGLGCGAISVLTDDCPVAVAASVLAYFGRENAGQCGSCFNGTVAMAAVAEALRDGHATAEDVARLQRWSGVLPGRGACGTLDGATNVAATMLTQFPQLVSAHLGNECDPCRAGALRAERPYAIEELPA
jgi:NADH:ubiquinone oxidoreductase subunit F (NADH-binding)